MSIQIVAKPKRLNEATAPKKPVRRKISLPLASGKVADFFVTVKHAEDPREVLQRKIGDVSEKVVKFARILVAIYIPPIVTQTAGGIILTEQISDADVQEYRHQGKVGLVVKMGPRAFVDDESTKFHGENVKVGDWVWFRPSDGIACMVNETPCRVIREGEVIGQIDHPDEVW